MQGVNKRGTAVNALYDDLTVADPDARLWPQTEFLKAALIHENASDALNAANALALYLDTPIRGLWRDRLKDDGTFEPEPAPASSFYHVAGAVMMLLDSPLARA